jgi:hypothetical protein
VASLILFNLAIQQFFPPLGRTAQGMLQRASFIVVDRLGTNTAELLKFVEPFAKLKKKNNINLKIKKNKGVSDNTQQ